MTVATRPRRGLLGLGLTLLAAAAPGCDRRARQGGDCRTHEQCAVGLECAEGHCHRPGAATRPGVPPVMGSLAARPEPPRAKDEAPEAAVALAKALGRPIKVNLYSSNVLPERTAGPGGEELFPDAAARELGKRVAALAKLVPAVSLGRKVTVSPTEAERLGLATFPAEGGVPVVVGAVLDSGGRREVLPAVLDPKEVSYALSAALWRLQVAVAGKLRVGFVCGAGAFCPTERPIPAPPAGGAWPEPVALALAEVHAPIEDLRRDLVRELSALGVEAVAVEPGSPPPDGLGAIVFAGPLLPIDDATLRAVLDRTKEGTGVALLLPGARYKASTNRVTAADPTDEPLLAAAGLKRENLLLSDAAAVAPFRVTAGPGQPPASVALSVAVAEVAAHGATAGLQNLTLPLAGSFTLLPDAPSRPLLWSRAAAVPLTLPLDATAESIARSVQAPSSTDRSVLAAATPDDDPKRSRLVVFGSALGIVAIDTPQLLASLLDDPSTRSLATADMVRKLAPYATAARAYRETHEVNRSLRRSSLELLARALEWASLPREIRSLAP